MRNSLQERVEPTPHKTCEIGAISPHKKVEQAKAFGKEIARAFELLGISRKDVVFTLNAADPDARQIDEPQVSRWCSGAETAPIARLNVELPGFRGAYITASSEASTGLDITHQHTIIWKRRADRYDD